jgi:lipopolysaccharide transport system permease protein
MLIQEETSGGCDAPPREAVEDSELPVMVIERRRGWRFLDLREVWRYRELLLLLSWRDVKVRYKQTMLGAAWAIIQPLATMAAFSLFMGRVASAADATVPYPLFVFAGLLPWTFFAGAVGAAATSVVGNEKLITKVYFPRALVPLSAIGVNLVDFGIAVGLLGLFMVGFGVVPGWGLLLAPLVVLTLLMIAAGAGILLAALTVAFRDFRHVVPFMLQFGLFATPAIFLQDRSALGPRTQALLPLLNPVQGVVVNFRATVLGGPLDWQAWACSAVWGLALLAAGSVYFRRVERRFADII